MVGADALSYYMDPQKFRAQTIFGDGGGAVVIRKGSRDGYGVKAYSTGASGADGFMAPAATRQWEREPKVRILA